MVQPAVGDPASAGGWTRWPTEVPSNPYYSVILWFWVRLGILSVLYFHSKVVLWSLSFFRWHWCYFHRWLLHTAVWIQW